MWNLSALVCLYTLASRTISFTDQAKDKFCIIYSQSQQEMNKGGVPRGWQVKTEGVPKRYPGPVIHFTQQFPLNWNVSGRRKRQAHEFKKVEKKKDIPGLGKWNLGRFSEDPEQIFRSKWLQRKRQSRWGVERRSVNLPRCLWTGSMAGGLANHLP